MFWPWKIPVFPCISMHLRIFLHQNLLLLQRSHHSDIHMISFCVFIIQWSYCALLAMRHKRTADNKDERHVHLQTPQLPTRASDKVGGWTHLRLPSDFRFLSLSLSLSTASSMTHQSAEPSIEPTSLLLLLGWNRHGERLCCLEMLALANGWAFQLHCQLQGQSVPVTVSVLSPAVVKG